MPSVKSFCHTSSAQMEKSQRGRGLSYFSGFFFSPTDIFMVQNQGKSQHYNLHEIFAGVGSEMFTLKTNRSLDMDEPCLAGKVIIAIHSRVTLM